MGQISEAGVARLVTKYTYDAAGQQTAVTEVTPDGHQITTTTTYDTAGRAIATTDALDNTTQSTYDGDGRLIKTTFADGSSIEYGYDSNGRKISETDQLGNTTNYEYDAEGHLTAVVGPAVIVPTTGQSVRPRTEYTYDQYGNLLTEKDALGRVTSFTYDPFGNETSRTLPQGQGDMSPPTETMTYNSFNQPVMHTDFAGNVTVNHYDPNLGRLTEADYYAAGHNPSTDPPDEQVTTQYNTLGQVSQVSDSDYGTVTYAYNADGQLSQEVTPEGELDYGYDPGTDNLISTTTSNSGIDYSYNVLGQLTSVHVVKQDGVDLVSAGTDQTQTYTYDDDGNVAHTQLSQGTSIISTADYTYDQLNQLKTLVQKDGAGNQLASYSY